MITRVTHTLRDARGNVFFVQVDTPPGAAEALGGIDQLRKAIDVAVWVIFGGRATSQHNTCVQVPDTEDP